MLSSVNPVPSNANRMPSTASLTLSSANPMQSGVTVRSSGATSSIGPTPTTSQAQLGNQISGSPEQSNQPSMVIPSRRPNRSSSSFCSSPSTSFFHQAAPPMRVDRHGTPKPSLSSAERMRGSSWSAFLLGCAARVTSSPPKAAS
ncbi:hypothetical protein U1Q18_039185 [Sarracenia purpurea var. burkii]